MIHDLVHEHLIVHLREGGFLQVCSPKLPFMRASLQYFPYVGSAATSVTLTQAEAITEGGMTPEAAMAYLRGSTTASRRS